MNCEREAAFKRIMGLIGMPPDGTTGYDEWLFNKSYSAGAEQMRECAAQITDDRSVARVLKDGGCGARSHRASEDAADYKSAALTNSAQPATKD